METINSSMSAILLTTMLIQEQFPELSKYISEMPVTIPCHDHPGITLASLKEYDDSLRWLLFNYSRQHDPIRFPLLLKIPQHEKNTDRAGL